MTVAATWQSRWHSSERSVSFLNDMIVPFKKHFNASDADPNNYLIVYPSGKVMSCGTLLNAKNTLGKEYPTR